MAPGKPHAWRAARSGAPKNRAGAGWLLLAPQDDTAEPNVLGAVRQQCHEAGALQGCGERALVMRAGAGLAARLDLGSIRQVAAQPVDVLVIDNMNLVHPELAEGSARRVTAAATAPG